MFDYLVEANEMLSWYISLKRLDEIPYLQDIQDILSQFIFNLPDAMKNMEHLKRRGRRSCWTNLTDFIRVCWNPANLRKMYNFSRIHNDGIEKVIGFLETFKNVYGTYENARWLWYSNKVNVGYSSNLFQAMNDGDNGIGLYNLILGIRANEDRGLIRALLGDIHGLSHKTTTLIQQLYDNLNDVQDILNRNEIDPLFHGYRLHQANEGPENKKKKNRRKL